MLGQLSKTDTRKQSGGAGYRPRPKVSDNLRRVGTLAGKPRIGTKLFARALADALRAFATVRFVAVMVDALTEANAAFYESQGFRSVPGTTNKLYLPASTLVEIASG